MHSSRTLESYVVDIAGLSIIRRIHLYVGFKTRYFSDLHPPNGGSKIHSADNNDRNMRFSRRDFYIRLRQASARGAFDFDQTCPIIKRWSSRCRSINAFLLFPSRAPSILNYTTGHHLSLVVKRERQEPLLSNEDETRFAVIAIDGMHMRENKKFK